jgi:8-oxo-dGTP pyrophosphatase MutT (NUDIX family)
MSNEQEPLIISSTVIVISKDRKALILQRSPTEKRFPNLWTVAGGKLQKTDGRMIGQGFYYNAVEDTICRELEEETGICQAYSRPRLKYLCSIVSTEAIKRLVISYYIIADFNSYDINITTENNQRYEWITEDQIDYYNFIFDIGEEIKDVFCRIKKGKA